jgi:hypothetical protein
MGPKEPFSEYGVLLFGGSVAAGVSISTFQKSANVWTNEIKNCPRWMRVAFVTLAVYLLAILCIQLIIFPASDSFPDLALTVSAFPLASNALSVCILYSVIWSGSIDEPELIRRTRKSAAALAISVIILFAFHTGYLKHPGR